jgi:hypothetical protein
VDVEEGVGRGDGGGGGMSAGVGTWPVCLVAGGRELFED